MIKKGALVLATSGLLVAAAALPSSASAIPCAEGDEPTCEWDIAKRGDPPRGMPCVDTSRSEVCFQTKGDWVWVQDEKRDGRSAIAAWGEADGARFGYCRNRSKHDNWAYCNKDFPEDTEVTLLAGTYNKSGPGPNDHIYDEFSEELSVQNTSD